MKVLIIDNYDSFVYNLYQYVGELGGKPIVLRNNKASLSKVKKIKPDKIIISAGPGTPEDKKYFGFCLEILRRISPKISTLGICLGHQGIITAFGGEIVQAKRLMHGKTSLIIHDGKGIFKGIKNPLLATRYHSLVGRRKDLPKCLIITAESIDDKEIMGVRHKEYSIEGVQFHPESILTLEGKHLIKNFLDGE
ncbi:MAG: aminodeoxychorismate/anthranilate synthase component II [Candidatus Bathyarchaeia archaeon]|nr:aminodeoxychorismate/anthranilate synthase component II [Candidatus Bathyarchaeota archaeon]